MRPAKDTERHIKNVYADGLKVTTSADLDERVLDNVMETLDELEKKESAAIESNIWRLIMKSKLTKLAAAAVIALAAIIGISQFAGGTITFADVIEPILNARTVVLDYVIGEGPDALEMHDIVIGSRIRRTTSNIDKTKILDSRVRSSLSNMDMTMILDLEDGRMLTLATVGVTKIASYNDIQGTGLEGTGSVLDFVRNVVSRVKDNPDADIQDLGEKEINGQKAVGFYVKGFNDGLTIWAPGSATETRCLGQLDRVFSIQTDLQKLGIGHEGDPLAVGREKRVAGLVRARESCNAARLIQVL